MLRAGSSRDHLEMLMPAFRSAVVSVLVTDFTVVESHPWYLVELRVGGCTRRSSNRFAQFHELFEAVSELWRPLPVEFPRRMLRSVFGKLMPVDEELLRERQERLSVWLSTLVGCRHDLPDELLVQVMSFVQFDDSLLDDSAKSSDKQTTHSFVTFGCSPATSPATMPAPTATTPAAAAVASPPGDFSDKRQAKINALNQQLAALQTQLEQSIDQKRKVATTAQCSHKLSKLLGVPDSPTTTAAPQPSLHTPSPAAPSTMTPGPAPASAGAGAPPSTASRRSSLRDLDALSPASREFQMRKQLDALKAQYDHSVSLLHSTHKRNSGLKASNAEVQQSIDTNLALKQQGGDGRKVAVPLSSQIKSPSTGKEADLLPLPLFQKEEEDQLSTQPEEPSASAASLTQLNEWGSFFQTNEPPPAHTDAAVRQPPSPPTPPSTAESTVVTQQAVALLSQAQAQVELAARAQAQAVTMVKTQAEAQAQFESQLASQMQAQMQLQGQWQAQMQAQMLATQAGADQAPAEVPIAPVPAPATTPLQPSSKRGPALATGPASDTFVSAPDPALATTFNPAPSSASTPRPVTPVPAPASAVATAPAPAFAPSPAPPPLDGDGDPTIEELLKQIAFLKEQLEAVGATPVELVSLEQAEFNMREAVTRLMSGDESAEADIDRWHKAVEMHPDFKARKETEARQWEEQEAPLAAAALRTTRSFVPLDVRHCSVDELVSRGVPKALATRVYQKKALWLTRMETDSIRRLHVADLRLKYSVVGLDLTELRAVWASVPADFLNDGDGKKSEWRGQIRDKLIEMGAKQRNNSLAKADERHRAYDNASPMFAEEGTAVIAATRSSAFDPTAVPELPTGTTTTAQRRASLQLPGSDFASQPGSAEASLGKEACRRRSLQDNIEAQAAASAAMRKAQQPAKAAGGKPSVAAPPTDNLLAAIRKRQDRGGGSKGGSDDVKNASPRINQGPARSAPPPANDLLVAIRRRRSAAD